MSASEAPVTKLSRDQLIQRERDEAWIGDAILSLCAREWILARCGSLDGVMLERMTSNQFLSCLGNPTTVESRIGLIYRDGGIAAVREWFEATLVPLYEKQEKKRRRGR